MNERHHHDLEEEKRIREAALDRTDEQSFPASDPPSTLPNPDDDTVLRKIRRAIPESVPTGHM